MRYSLVGAVLLCALLCATSRAGADVRAVKLCGREFLRAVVYTCGGSRWRRLLSEPETEGDQGSLESGARSMGTELTRRDINHILTTVCCQVGCRKSDLSYLC
ncbi:hypothetical protein NHX12_033016 [Muraenolepis orangiensis]|uniref:Insulin-like domain-containing protein n=1 Tax=Muraenolepis orangiensis TaxID=630683 RepID=A0A9Q0IIB3_9TELE|nr:hypothetical protein NHX12_033016 [Muraenolepis orangiensis]